MIDLQELEAQARERLAPEVYDFLAGGAFDEITLEDNVQAWSRYRLRPRVLRDVREVSTHTTVLGAPLAHPVAVAPTAFHRLVHDDGERASAGGAADAGALFTLSTRTSVPIEQVASERGDAPWWFQVYVLQDRAFSDGFIDRAVACGARALVLTGDTPALGRRLRDLRNGWSLPSGLGTIE